MKQNNTQRTSSRFRWMIGSYKAVEGMLRKAVRLWGQGLGTIIHRRLPASTISGWCWLIRASTATRRRCIGGRSRAKERCHAPLIFFIAIQPGLCPASARHPSYSSADDRHRTLHLSDVVLTSGFLRGIKKPSPVPVLELQCCRRAQLCA